MQSSRPEISQKRKLDKVDICRVLTFRVCEFSHRQVENSTGLYIFKRIKSKPKTGELRSYSTIASFIVSFIVIFYDKC